MSSGQTQMCHEYNTYTVMKCKPTYWDVEACDKHRVYYDLRVTFDENKPLFHWYTYDMRQEAEAEAARLGEQGALTEIVVRNSTTECFSWVIVNRYATQTEADNRVAEIQSGGKMAKTVQRENCRWEEDNVYPNNQTAAENRAAVLQSQGYNTRIDVTTSLGCDWLNGLWNLTPTDSNNPCTFQQTKKSVSPEPGFCGDPGNTATMEARLIYVPENYQHELYVTLRVTAANPISVPTAANVMVGAWYLNLPQNVIDCSQYIFWHGALANQSPMNFVCSGGGSTCVIVGVI